MTSDDVSKRIEAEIGGRWSDSNLHGIDLRQCLVRPTLTKVIHQRVRDGRIHEELVEVWLVLEEKPIERNGYKIVFDEDSLSFGLAWSSAPHPLLFGLYGDFITTMKAI
jgi:hypothetical protein